VRSELYVVTHSLIEQDGYRKYMKSKFGGPDVKGPVVVFMFLI